AREGRWFLTRMHDRFGNEVLYRYQKVIGRAFNGRASKVPIDIALVRIEYGGNPGAGIAPMIRLELEYAAALDLVPGSDVPIGAAFTLRNGIRTYRGARRLDAIATWVDDGSGWRQRRRVELTYDMSELSRHVSGPRLHAPLRILTGVRERGWSLDGQETAAPPVTLHYGRLERAFSV